MNLNEYIDEYIDDHTHWYISKVKEINKETINEFAKGLRLIINLLSPFPDKQTIKTFSKFFDSKQLELIKQDSAQIEITFESELFLSLQILNKNLRDLSHVEATNKEKFLMFQKMLSDFQYQKDSDHFRRTYDSYFITNDLNIHFRNFFSWLKKFGFIGKYNNRSRICFITDIGYKFAETSDDISKTSAIFHNQIKKLQVWNPTLNVRYEKIRVNPYYFILEILLKLSDNYFTRDEYVLFITKAKSNSKIEVKKVIELINKYRILTDDEKRTYKENIRNSDLEKYPERSRPLIVEIFDTYSKEIGAYTFGNLIINDGNKITLFNTEQAEVEINSFNNSFGYIDIKDEYDWVRHYGSLDGMSIEEIIDLYVRYELSDKQIEVKFEYIKDENTKKEIIEEIQNKLFEKAVEKYFIINLKEISPNLKIYKKGEKNGNQFQTEVGPIDLLCFDKHTKQFVVIEFKRDQVSDDTVGQILRYMGWVYMNLSPDDTKVHGYIVGKNFPEKLHYALFGLQINETYDLIHLHEHQFDDNNLPP